MPPPRDDVILAALAEILKGQAEILALLKVHKFANVSTSTEDHNLLVRLLPLIRARFGDAVFSVASLRAESVAMRDVALAAALDACGSARSTGRLFARCEGRAINGWSVHRVSARIWQLKCRNVI